MTSRSFYATEIRTAVESSVNEALKSILTKNGYTVDVCAVENLTLTKTADYNPLVIDFEIKAILSESKECFAQEAPLNKMKGLSFDEKAEIFCDEFAHGGCSVSDFERIKEYLIGFLESEKK